MSTPSPATSPAMVKGRSPYVISGLAIVSFVALIKLVLHLYADRFYGYFVDELYFIACSNHLAAGYVDQPPLIAFIVRFERLLFGDSLQAIRFLPAVAGAVKVFLAGWMARELGGKRFAQAIAALATMLGTAYFAFDHYVSMNAFEPLFWMGSAAILIRIIKTGNQKLWLWFGVLAGLGLLNKHSMAFFGLGIVVGLLTTEHRRMLAQKWIWIGGLIAFVIFLPNLIWNVQHHWPFFELLRNIKADGRNVQLSWPQFIKQQFELMMPASGPLWAAGLGWLLFARNGRSFRPLATSYLVILACMLLMDGRTYYMLPAYPMLFAAGGVAFESWLARPLVAWIKPSYAVVLVAMGAVGAPLALPILPPQTYIRYTERLHMGIPKIENHDMGPLPQFYADMFGWEEMTEAVAKAFNALPEDERPRTAIFSGNYGQAGAIDLFGKKYGLPKAIGNHQNYWYWGPRDYTGDSVIVMGARRDELEPFWTSIEAVGQVHHPYSMPYEHFTLYHCRGIKQPIGVIWPKIKNWH